MIFFLKCYVFTLILIQIIYTLRQFLFSTVRKLKEQPLSYEKIIDSDFIPISVFVPMHNEEKVAANILERLIACIYPKDKLEIIPINDHSKDRTKEILDDYQKKYPDLIHPIHRHDGLRGKAHALNEALKKAKGEIILIFDADYQMPKDLLMRLANCFKDPMIGAVMGRVVPINGGQNLLTRLLELERTGGYQIDQQARHTLNLIPQYGGTAGGIRKKLLVDSGGFDPSILAEDTEITFRFYTNGWKVLYSHTLECYEEVPEDWKVRFNQVKRWSRGHNQTLFRYLNKIFNSKYLSLHAKIDGLCLLGIYIAPVFMFFGIFALFILLATGNLSTVYSTFAFLLFASFASFGNFAPFFQCNLGACLDGARQRILLLPFLSISILFNLIAITQGFFEAIVDHFTKRAPSWIKTDRYAKKVP